MDHIKILKRAFEVTRAYRVLWIFGILLALTSGGGGGGGGGNSGTRMQRDAFDLPRDIPGFQFEPAAVGAWIGVGIAILCLILFLIVLSTILRYVSETSLLRMVDEYEDQDTQLGFRQGWRLGWSNRAFRMWLADLVTGLIFFFGLILLIGLAALPFLVWMGENTAAQVTGTVAGIGLVLLVVFLAILAGIGLALLGVLWRRAIALEDLGPIAGIRRAFELLRNYFKDTFIMGLIFFGISLLWGILMIPVFFLVLLAAGMIGGIPGLLAGLLVNTFAEGAAPWIVGAVVGAPLFFVVMVVPLTFIGGLFETYKSTVWTLTYRELLAIEAAAAGPEQEPAVLDVTAEPPAAEDDSDQDG